MYSTTPLFHLALPMKDKEATRAFYVDMFGATIGREADLWIDINFWNHQVSFHLKPEAFANQSTNAVDGKDVPVRHFGVILDWDKWHELAKHLQSHNIAFIIDPYVRFKGKIGEQATMFFLDPSGNALEFKSFKDMTQVFAS